MTRDQQKLLDIYEKALHIATEELEILREMVEAQARREKELHGKRA